MRFNFFSELNICEQRMNTITILTFLLIQRTFQRRGYFSCRFLHCERDRSLKILFHAIKLRICSVLCIESKHIVGSICTSRVSVFRIHILLSCHSIIFFVKVCFDNFSILCFASKILSPKLPISVFVFVCVQFSINTCIFISSSRIVDKCIANQPPSSPLGPAHNLNHISTDSVHVFREQKIALCTYTHVSILKSTQIPTCNLLSAVHKWMWKVVDSIPTKWYKTML